MDSIYLQAQKPPHVCQDCCLVGENDYFKYAILADGCSSSEDTDFGSKLLVHTTKAILDNNKKKLNIDTNLNFYKHEIINTSKKLIESIGMNYDCLDSTLLISILKNDSIYNIMFGDGSIIITDKENEISYFKSISYDGNAPYYLSYLLDSERKELYDNSVKNKKTEIYSNVFEKEEFINNATIISHMQYALKNINSFFMTSDGIESFYNYKTNERVPSIEIVKELINIKSKNGEFIKRRVRRMMEDLAKNNIYNSDDLSVCGFLVVERE